MSASPLTSRCFWTSLVFAWVAVIFLPSIFIALFGLSPAAAGEEVLSAVLEIADEVAPAAKLSFPLLFGGSLLLARRLGRDTGATLNALFACIAALLALALLPADLSRGFGVGLTGTRFDPALLPIYLGSAAVAGLVFTSAERRCHARQHHGEPSSTA